MNEVKSTTINWKQGNPKVDGEYLVLHENGSMSYAGCDIESESITSWWTLDGYNAEVILGKVIGFYDINGHYEEY